MIDPVDTLLTLTIDSTLDLLPVIQIPTHKMQTNLPPVIPTITPKIALPTELISSHKTLTHKLALTHALHPVISLLTHKTVRLVLLTNSLPITTPRAHKILLLAANTLPILPKIDLFLCVESTQICKKALTAHLTMILTQKNTAPNACHQNTMNLNVPLSHSTVTQNALSAVKPTICLHFAEKLPHFHLKPTQKTNWAF